MLLAEPQLALGAQHAVRLHAADLGHADLSAARQRGARRRERRPDADRGVRRAAHDRKARAAGAHAAQEQPVAVALADLALDGLDLADHDAPHVRRDRRHAGHLEPRVDQPVGRVLGGEVDVDHLPHPAVRDLHANWRRKRRSFSKKSRRSSTP